MMSGGGPEFQIFYRDNDTASALFEQFQREYDDAARRGSSTIRVAGRDVHLHAQNYDAWQGQYMAYSRRFQIEDGSWRTFQVLRYAPGPASRVHGNFYWFKVFDGKGHKLAETAPPPDSDEIFRLFEDSAVKAIVWSALAACVDERAPARDEKRCCPCP